MPVAPPLHASFISMLNSPCLQGEFNDVPTTDDFEGLRMFAFGSGHRVPAFEP